MKLMTTKVKCSVDDRLPIYWFATPTTITLYIVYYRPYYMVNGRRHDAFTWWSLPHHCLAGRRPLPCHKSSTLFGPTRSETRKVIHPIISFLAAKLCVQTEINSFFSWSLSLRSLEKRIEKYMRSIGILSAVERIICNANLIMQTLNNFYKFCSAIWKAH